MSEFLDSFLDDEDRALDLLREDGWTYGEIRDRAHRLDGEYRGAKGEGNGNGNG